MTPVEMEEAAELLHHAALNHQPVTPLRHRWPDMTQEQAYAIAQINTARYIAAGARRTGCKVGLTSRAVQQQLGVDQPDFGILFNYMEFGDNEVIPASALLQPKAEAEIAFVLGKDLNLEHIVLKDVLSAIEYALPAIEVVGSRIENWDIRITDTIADNASSGCYVLGTTPRKLTDIDLRLCGMVMSRCGNPVSTGAGVACLGNPLNAVVWLARTMVSSNTPLKAGDVVLSGALGPMATVTPGDVLNVRIDGVGDVRACFEPSDSRESVA